MSEDVLAALETDAATSAGAGVEAGRSDRPCDSAITAIYPVRYGYANLFDQIVAPASPPPLSTLLSATSIAEGQGYVTRLLRPGWIYIREEAGGSAMQIFKYERHSPDGTVTNEAFRKYMFQNGNNAQGGMTLDRSSGRAFYPFVFVNKGVSEVSILYTEHELPAGIVDKINGDSGFRAKTMQRINIASGGRDAVKATAENLGKLVEDYRARRERVLEEVEGIGLDQLTTQASFELDPANVAQQIRNTECYGDSSMIVGLHDPVGRQFEITQGHAKLAMWEQDTAALNLYPYMIGQFVEGARLSPVPEVAAAVNENINIAEHQQYWGEMARQFENFKARRNEIMTLYRAFMYPGEKTDEVGSLDRYFRYFFDYDNPDEAQLRQLLEVAAPIFDGLMASEQGQEALTELAENAHGPEADKPVWEQRNAYGAVVKGFISLTTQPQDGLDWAKTTSGALDRLLNGLGAFWGKAVADSIFAVGSAKQAGSKLSADALQNLVDKAIPKALDIFGIRITAEGGVGYTTTELGEIIGKAMSKSLNAGNTYAGIRYLEGKQAQLEYGRRIFNWGEIQRSERLPRLWQLANVEVTRPSGSQYRFASNETTSRQIGIMVDSGFAGLSAFFNIMAITSLTNQSRFERMNPLARGNMVHDALSLGAAVSALTVDMMVLSGTGLRITGKAAGVLPASVATRLAPSIQGSAARVARVLAGTLPTKLIAVANFAGAVSSGWSALNEFNQGNTGAAVGHGLVALGAGILFFQAAAGLAGFGAASSATVIGLPVGVVIAVLSLVLVGIGAVVTLFYTKTAFELLLYQCFWGQSKDYAFWQEGVRTRYADRLDSAQMIATGGNGAEAANVKLAFRMEVQEFMNVFTMPSLDLDRTGGSLKQRLFGRLLGDGHYDMEFLLPQFVLGQSDLVAGVSMLDASTYEDGITATSFDTAATQKLADAISSAFESGQYVMVDGALKLKVRVDFGGYAEIVWHYEPKPGVIVPMRFIGADGKLRPSEVTVGMRDDRPF